MTPGPSLNISGDKMPKFKEEADHFKQRLSDQRFNMRDYPDPLLPRDIARERHVPQGYTAEKEKHLLDAIARVKAGESLKQAER
ncbi:hypothetical protein TruAng_001023 [Truncatella angustata]|nr:hypothetical protein TruAng_001023 [Truncatella angustata]